MKQKISQYWLFLLISVVMSVLAMIYPTNAQDNSPIPIIAVLKTQLEDLKTRVDTLEAENQVLKTKLACVSNNSDSINFFFDGCDVHVRNGTGRTDSINSKGNLIVGYNKDSPFSSTSLKTGSHNLIVGEYHNYSSYGGVVAGLLNTITAPWATVSGGTQNTASGTLSSVTGGYSNTASRGYSSITGGAGNNAIGVASSVSGGFEVSAIGDRSSVSGGYRTIANGEFNWAAGSLLEPN